ncbi:laminarinase [Flavobacterium album]|uniref:Laminarinase n=1 Tax=Flavobacterium album TaxID=2175091 RepID=A0A2S1R336_9FLAO|nr:glycoside hydrolase family 16 protein [Flavobacterium album]AWH87064.1 laminarinase [Flavobacterium album]
MKKTLKTLGTFLMLLFLVTGCQDDDTKFGDIVAPTNLAFTYDVVGKSDEFPNGDGSGKVVLRATADNAISFKYMIQGGGEATVAGGVYPYTVTAQGVNSYEVVVIAYGKGGVATTASFMMEDVLLNFRDDETTQFLTGGTSKVWYIAAAEAGHLGVGPNTPDGNNNWPSYYAAAPFEKAGSDVSSCFYNNKFTFSLDGEQIKFENDNGGATFFNASYTSVGGTPLGADNCLPYDVSGVKNVTLGAASSYVSPAASTGTQFTISNNGFLGYYIGSNTYEVLSITATRMQVRVVQGNNTDLAWYLILTTQPPYPDDEPVYDNLVWEDQFNVDGAPDASKWTMEIGNNNGWGNGEKQYYKAENAVVSGGTLKITAKAENFGGQQYTSARMKTENKFEFTYGKVVVRAKLPTGSGTWPALWLLGANQDVVGWPACGEIDMMEHVGNEPNKVSGTLHYPGHSAGNADSTTTTVNGVQDGFHTYSINWSPSFIRFYVDDVEFKTFPNSAAVPFNHDFFLIFNVAMGGSLGGTIAPGFTQSSMEIDYVQVFQE